MKRLTDASWKVYTGKSEKKALIHMPIIKAGTVQTYFGTKMIYVEVYGECRSCHEKVWYGRTEARSQWVPLLEKSPEDAIYELHRCPEELKRNQALRQLVYGKQNSEG